MGFTTNLDAQENNLRFNLLFHYKDHTLLLITAKDQNEEIKSK